MKQSHRTKRKVNKVLLLGIRMTKGKVALSHRQVVTLLRARYSDHVAQG